MLYNITSRYKASFRCHENRSNQTKFKKSNFIQVNGSEASIENHFTKKLRLLLCKNRSSVFMPHVILQLLRLLHYNLRSRLTNWQS